MATDGFDGMAELIADLERLPQELQREGSFFVQTAAETMASEARNEYPVKDGDLARGVKVDRQTDLRAQVKNTAKHATLYERGTIQRFTAGKGANRGTMPAGNVFIPAAVKARSQMVDRLVGLVKRSKVRGMTGTLDVVPRGD